MPQLLIQRVDVVTGGASASWGSDAISGVVNFVTDRKFEGFKMNAQAGISTYGDAGNTLFQTAAGTSFAGGRGHFEIAGEYAYNDGLLPRYPVDTQHSAQPNIGGRTLARSRRKRARQSRALSRRSIDHEIPLIPLLFPMF